jgi:hypothetical protein
MALKHRGLWATFALGAVLIALLVRLGLWQLDRAQQKRVLYAQYTAVAHASAIPVGTTSSAELANQLWRPVTVTGQFLPVSLLLDNRVRDGIVGYDVLSPFQLTDARVVLVDRGWVKAPDLRSDWPAVLAPSTTGVLGGRLAPSPSTGIRLSNTVIVEPGPAGMWRTQSIDFPALSVALSVKLEPFIVLLDDGTSPGYDRRWTLPVADDGKHQAYAVQWFTMAACVPLLLAYWVRRSRDSSSAEAS